MLLGRAVVGTPTPGAAALFLEHPDHHFVVLLTLKAEDAHTRIEQLSAEFSTGAQHTAVELHHYFAHLVQELEQVGATFSCISVMLTGNQVFCLAYKAGIWLRRDHKIGQILSAKDQLLVIEGKSRPEDTYLCLTETQLAHFSHWLPALQQSRLDQGLWQQLQQESPEPLIGNTGIARLEIQNDDYRLPVEESVTSGDAAIAPSAAQNATGMFRNFSKKLKKVPNLWQPLFSQDVYVRRQHRQSLLQKTAIVFAIVAALVLALGWNSFQRAQQQRQVTQLLIPFRTELAQVQNLASTDPIAARTQAADLVQKMEIVSEQHRKQPVVYQGLQKELSVIKQFEQDISGQREMPVLPTFFDLRFVLSNFIASSMDISGDTLVFLDHGQKKSLGLSIPQKQATLLPIGELSNVRDLSLEEKQLYILGDDISVFTLDKSQAAEGLKVSPDRLQTSSQLIVFGNFLYVLNKEQRNIFRYTLDDKNEVTGPIGWVQSDQDLDFTSIESFAVDGDVWVTTTKGEVRKFTGGKATAFSISGLEEPFNSPIRIFTKKDMANIYILEPAKNRVVVLSKSGVLVKEVKSSTLASATSVVANEALKKIFVLSGSLVFEIEL